MKVINQPLKGKVPRLTTLVLTDIKILLQKGFQPIAPIVSILVCDTYNTLDLFAPDPLKIMLSKGGSL